MLKKENSPQSPAALPVQEVYWCLLVGLVTADRSAWKCLSMRPPVVAAESGNFKCGDILGRSG